MPLCKSNNTKVAVICKNKFVKTFLPFTSEVGVSVGSGIKLATTAKNITPAKNYMNEKMEHLVRTNITREKMIQEKNIAVRWLVYDSWSAKPTQRLPFKKPNEFKALWAKSKNDMLSIKPAAKPFIQWNSFRKQNWPSKANQQIEYISSHLTKERKGQNDSNWINAFS